MTNRTDMDLRNKLMRDLGFDIINSDQNKRISAEDYAKNTLLRLWL